MVETGSISLDANVLHHLYRLGDQQRQQVLSALAAPSIRDRLWLPYQVGLEYQRNRLSNAHDQSRVYTELAEETAKHGRQLKAKFEQQISDPRVRRIPVEKLEKLIASLSEELSKLAKEHVIDFKTISDGDPVRAALDALFNTPDKIGKKPSEEILRERVAEASKRYTKRTPPGYKDAEGANKKIRPEGDYLIWCELLDFAESSSRPLLFVTNDEKEDWYRKGPDDKILGPRPELRSEMATKTEQPYHQTTLTGFLRLTERYLDIKVDEATIKQVDATQQQPSRHTSTTLRARTYAHEIFQTIIRRKPEYIISEPIDGGFIDYIVETEEKSVAIVIKYFRHGVSIKEVRRLASMAAEQQQPVIVVMNNFSDVDPLPISHWTGMNPTIFVRWAGHQDDPRLLEAIDSALSHT
ncbi:hypothetical protein BJY24_003780 [Nocardia transvalensis]|uniref:PIN like domain-containing protein n=1 Tax=Nocardia transvalensis TaxID=37333 RepID=A0A7W9UIZ5_9NOCA|nr:PIN domain-containing protein [Nocardia transvalensis]MBB5914913.1 hypothetical protein [Nocardia transvalensis]